MSRKTLICLLAGALVLVARAALLPVWPVPLPAVHDEFSYLLQADTFAHGRLTNPPHPLWRFFESIYILQQPTYASKYPPGQALVLAAGQAASGNPWYGVWLSCGVLAATLCWALQGWFRPGWALLGTFFSLDLCLFSYWMNSYWGGALAGIGGALMVGAWPRIVRARQAGFAWLFGGGAVILLLTRPYEGFLLAAPATAALALGVKRDRLRVWIPILLVTAAGLCWQALYDYRITGHPLRMPYQEYSAQYESAPPLIVMPMQPAKVYRHLNLEFHDSAWSRKINERARSWKLPLIRLRDLYDAAATIFGSSAVVMVLPIFAPWWLTSRRLRGPIVLAGVLVGGAMLERVFQPHYAAPFAAVLLILLVASLRRLKVWWLCHLPGGRRGSRLGVAAVSLGMAGWSLASDAGRVAQPPPVTGVLGKNALERDLLQRRPGRHVILVRYTGGPDLLDEWIYNPADIDGAPVIWAQDMGSENRALQAYYPRRTFWLFEPKPQPGRLRLYADGL